MVLLPLPLDEETLGFHSLSFHPEYPDTPLAHQSVLEDLDHSAVVLPYGRSFFTKYPFPAESSTTPYFLLCRR